MTCHVRFVPYAEMAGPRDLKALNAGMSLTLEQKRMINRLVHAMDSRLHLQVIVYLANSRDCLGRNTRRRPRQPSSQVMRASELRGPRWSHVDLDTGIAHVRQRADAWGTIGPPKSKAGKRDIPSPPMVVNALSTWEAACPKGKLDLVFPNGRGDVKSLTNIWHRFWTAPSVKVRHRFGQRRG